MKKMSKKEYQNQSLEKALILYRTKFNLGSEYRTRLSDARLGYQVCIAQWLDGGGCRVVHRYTTPEELLFRIMDSLVSGEPLF